MAEDQNKEDGKLMLMVSPTAGKVLLVLPNNIIGFTGLDSVAAFADRLTKEITTARRMLGQDSGMPIASNYESKVIAEWETTLKENRSDNEISRDD